jgi:hypothetical protein
MQKLVPRPGFAWVPGPPGFRAGGGAGQPDQDPDDELTVAGYVGTFKEVCPECGLRFATVKLLGRHRRYRHAVPSLRRQFAVGSLCSVCNTKFHMRARLVRHLNRVVRCFHELSAREPLDEEDFESAEAQTAADRRAARSAGSSVVACLLSAVCS